MFYTLSIFLFFYQNFFLLISEIQDSDQEKYVNSRRLFNALTHSGSIHHYELEVLDAHLISKECTELEPV